MNVSKRSIQRAQKVVIYGPEGIGKTTLAAQFPDPLFFDLESGSYTFDVHRYEPTPLSWEALGHALVNFQQKNKDYKTIVIDTVDYAERLCAESIVNAADKTGIEDFGYGKGYTHLAERFGKFLNFLGEIINMGINVVTIAHSTTRKFELPEESGAFDRYELKLEKKVAPLLKEWADIVLFMNYKTLVVKTENKKKRAIGGQRVIYTSHHVCWDAKNRHGLPEEIPADFSAIAHIFPSSHIIKSGHANSLPAPPTTDAIGQKIEHSPQAQTQVEPPKPDESEYRGLPDALVQLMRADNVTRKELQAAVAKRGYYPADTDPAVYDPSFVNGAIIAGWKNVLSLINDIRKDGTK